MNGPETTQLRSSNLASATYDPEVENLTIDFVTGASYTYFNVPQNVYRSLTLAGSAGEYFQRNIKGRYGYEQN